MFESGECAVTDDGEAGRYKEGGECCLLSFAGVSVATCPSPSAAKNRQLSFKILTMRVRAPRVRAGFNQSSEWG